MIKKLFLLMIGRVQPVEAVEDVLRSLSDEIDRLNDIRDYHKERVKELRSDIATAQAEIEESEREIRYASKTAERLISVIINPVDGVNEEK